METSQLAGAEFPPPATRLEWLWETIRRKFRTDKPNFGAFESNFDHLFSGETLPEMISENVFVQNYI